jgi:hypothetical protein
MCFDHQIFPLFVVPFLFEKAIFIMNQNLFRFKKRNIEAARE